MCCLVWVNGGAIGCLSKPMEEWLISAIRLMIPVAFGSLGGLLAERSGVYNIGLEGFLLWGAFSSVAGAVYTGSVIGSIVFCLLSTWLLAIMFSWWTVSLRGNQFVSGIAWNLFI